MGLTDWPGALDPERSSACNQNQEVELLSVATLHRNLQPTSLLVFCYSIISLAKTGSVVRTVIAGTPLREIRHSCA